MLGAVMTAAPQLPTTGPARFGGRLAPPPRPRIARPEKRAADQKTASRIFFEPAPKPRLETRTLTLGTHQENPVFSYDFASGCAVAPDRTAAVTGSPSPWMPNGPTVGQVGQGANGSLLDSLGGKLSVDFSIPVPNPFGPRAPGGNRVTTWFPLGVHLDVTVSRTGVDGEAGWGLGLPTNISSAAGFGVSGGLNLRVIGNYDTDTDWSASVSGGRGYGGSVEAGFKGLKDFKVETLDLTIGAGYGLGGTLSTSQEIFKKKF